MADTPEGSPLTEEHLTQINQGLKQVADAKKQIALAERAGIDVAQLKAANNQAEEKLLQLKQVYFPGR